MGCFLVLYFSYGRCIFFQLTRPAELIPIVCNSARFIFCFICSCLHYESAKKVKVKMAGDLFLHARQLPHLFT